MKNILLLLIILPTIAFSQADSAKVTVNNVVIKAKDLYFIKFNLDNSNRFETIDSVLKDRIRALSPGDNNDVTLNGVERRAYRDIYAMLYYNIFAWQGGVQKRVHDAILLIDDVWLNDKIPKEENTVSYDNQVSEGKKMAKKQN